MRRPPADVVARPVQRDVQGVEVAGLPPVKLGQVNSLQKNTHEMRGVEAAAELPAGHEEHEDENLPQEEAEATVGELLHVHPQEAGMQRHAAVELVGEWARGQVLPRLGASLARPQQVPAEHQCEEVAARQELWRLQFI